MLRNPPITRILVANKWHPRGSPRDGLERIEMRLRTVTLVALVCTALAGAEAMAREAAFTGPSTVANSAGRKWWK
jgi:hypothetical protein